MDLEGQGASAASGKADRSGLDDRGYILVALLVAIAISAVWMTALLPAWRQQTMREREIELIYRGEQYARAIWLYQQKNNGQFPQNIDDLISQHMLRHKWKDPITGEEFLPVAGVACAMGIPGGIPGPGGTPGRGTPGGTPVPGRSGGGTPAPAPTPGRGITPPATSPGSRGLPGGAPSGTPGASGAGGICGVVSKSDKASIKIYQQQQQHNLWQFTALSAQARFDQNRMKYGGGVAPPVGMPQIPGTTRPGTVPGGPGRGPAGGPAGPFGPGRGPGGPGRGPGGFDPFPTPGQGPGRDNRPVGPAPIGGGPGRGRGGH